MPLFNSMRLDLFEGLLATSDRLAVRMDRPARLADHLALGLRGEEAAFFHLRRLGFTVIARRWQSHRCAGDLDLIAWEGDTLCFIEVKTRSGREIAAAEAAVDEYKRKTLRRIARHYLRQVRPEPSSRFDVLSIYMEEAKAPEFHLFRGAFGWS